MGGRRMQLFDGGGDSDSHSGDKEEEKQEAPSLEINEEYARRYEYNKNREDLHRLEELKKRGLFNDEDDESGGSESSEDDDDVDEIVRKESSKQKELELLEAIIKVRNRDPILKNKDVELFKSDEKDETEKVEENGDTEIKSEKKKKEKKKEKKKKVYLKDVIATQLLEGGAEFSESNNDDGRKSYGEEQEQLRREFLEAVNEDEEEEEEEDLLKVKDGNAVEEDEDDDDEEFNKKLEECFPDEEDDKDRFLKEYIKNQMWLDKGGQGRGGGSEIRGEDLEMVSEDEMEIEKQEEYEYRFQENAGDRVLGHAREVEGSVRKKVKARKEQRKNKEERMEIAKLEREEELRHMKNLKKKENEEKVKKIMKIAGIKDGEESLFNSKELEGDFDPQEYDRMMKKAFNEGYYEDEDEEFGSDVDEDDGDIEKPDFDKEDELLGLPKGWDGAGSGAGFLAAREKVLKLKETKTGSDSEEEEEDEKEDTDDEDDDEEGEDGEEEREEDKMSEEGKKEKKRKLAILERAKKEMLDEYYKLDYEDTIGDLKTRFRYAKIKPNRFGLTTAEVLMMDEKELNQYVSLKKLAPYTELEWKVPNSKRNEIKKRAREIFRHGKVDDKKRSTKKFKVKDDRKDSHAPTSATTKHGKEQVQDSSGETTIKLSRSARRKQNKKAAALPPSRLKAYGVE